MGRKRVSSTKVKVGKYTFDSKLEYEMYKELKRNKIKFLYNELSYEVLSKDTLKNYCYERPQRRSVEMKDRRAVTPIKYTPDFTGINGEWVIEVKGRANESFPLRWKLFKKYINEKENPPLIFKPQNIKDIKQTVKILKENGY